MKLNWVFIVLVVSLVTGCSSSAPKCSDAKVTDLVKQISAETLGKQRGAETVSQVAFAINSVRTTDFNEKTGTQNCAARLEMTGIKGKDAIDIVYKSEKTDGGDGFFVTVFGLEAMLYAKIY